VRRDATVCVALAKDEYNPDVGARSLQNAVDESIVQPLVAAYLDVDEDIREGTPLAKFEFDVQPDGEIVTYLTKGR
jgi:ATP-dependent Clp protease ATP-binding subunit ClpA